MPGLKLAFRERKDHARVHRRACLFDLRVGIGYLFVVHFLFFLGNTDISSQAKREHAIQDGPQAS